MSLQPLSITLPPPGETKNQLPSYSTLLNTTWNGNFMANVGWEETSSGNCELNSLYSEPMLDAVSKAITKALEGVDPQGRPIIVSNENIAGVISNVYRFGTRTDIGDIHSRFIVPHAEARNDLRTIMNQAINIIVSNIRNEIEMTENNKKLTVWTTLLGDFNKEGLRAHSQIKIRRRHPQYMAFNMNY
jgi:hypothetical protein